jgi:hypothetical protein
MLFVKQVKIRLTYSFLLVYITCTKGLPCSVSHMHVLCIGQINSLCSLFSISLSLPFSRAFSGLWVASCHLHSATWCILALFHIPSFFLSLLSSLSLLPRQSFCYSHGVVYMHVYLFIYMLGLDSAYEGTCDLCPSEHGLLYLKGLFPVLSIFLQMPHFILLYG